MQYNKTWVIERRELLEPCQWVLPLYCSDRFSMLLNGIHNEPENLSLQSHLSFDMFQHLLQQFVVKKENVSCIPYTYICFVEPTVEYRCRLIA